MDVPVISLVVQFGVPENLGVWLQRAGRAGRSSLVTARAVMLVEKSVVQVVGAPKTDEAEDDLTDSEFEEEEEKIEGYRESERRRRSCLICQYALR